MSKCIRYLKAVQAFQACRLLSTPQHPGGRSQGLAQTGELLLDTTCHWDFFVDFLFWGNTLRVSLAWKSECNPSWSCPVVSLLAQPFKCCDYRLKRPDLAQCLRTPVFACMRPTLLNLREACKCQVILECGLAGDTRRGPRAFMRNHCT